MGSAASLRPAVRRGLTELYTRVASTEVPASVGFPAQGDEPPPPAELPPRGNEPVGGCVAIMLLGPPASGKSTLGERLAEHFGGSHVDLGAMLRSGADVGMDEWQRILETATEEGRRRGENSGGAVTLFVNGFPRMLDGLEFWESQDMLVQPSLALVLEAPDDVLKVRAAVRGRASDQKEGGFSERLDFYRRETEKVARRLADSGRVRYLDATVGPDFLVATAISLLRTSVVLACGDPGLRARVCNKIGKEPGLAALRRLDIQSAILDGLPAPPEPGDLVRRISALTLSLGRDGGTLLLEGFPRDVADLRAWQRLSPWVETVLMLDFVSGIDAPEFLVRKFGDDRQESVDRAIALVRSCLPLSVAVPEAAVGHLGQWICSAASLRWWDQASFPQMMHKYDSYMRAQVRLHDAISDCARSGAPVRPIQSPSTEAWLGWFSHLLHAERYHSHSVAELQGHVVGPLLPARMAGPAETGRLAEPSSVPDGAFGGLESDALVGAPIGFVDGLASLEDAGLAPLSDPRALWYAVAGPGATMPPPPGDAQEGRPVEVAGLVQAGQHNGHRGVVRAVRDDGRREVEMDCGKVIAVKPENLAVGDAAASALLRLLGLFYRRFLLVMVEAGPASRAGPPGELDWIWHAHTMHPSAYAEDCRRLFGHVMHHAPCKRAPKSAPEEAARARSLDSGEAAVIALSDSLREALRALAKERMHELTQAGLWPFRQASRLSDGDTLCSLLPGGNRRWFADRLAGVGGRVGAALLEAANEPEAWESPPAEASEGSLAALKVTVCLLSGQIVLETSVDPEALVMELIAELREAGETNDFKLLVDGVELHPTDCLSQVGSSAGRVVSLVRLPKPVNTRVYLRSVSPPTSRRCSCFTQACLVHVLGEGGVETRVAFADLRVGDVVNTGASRARDRHRRVTRIWPCEVPTGSKTPTFEVVPGCRLTGGHPVQHNGSWCRPEELCEARATREPVVYTLELEGHVDTVLVGRDAKTAAVCAAIGVYCGPRFGWNIFTRKTRPCDAKGCQKCRVAVVLGLDFSLVEESMLEARYEPY